MKQVIAENSIHEPVFIGQLTSEYLFEQTKRALMNSYKSKSYINRYALEAQSLATYDCSSECIDFMLSKGHHKLADFLYSQVNTNCGSQSVSRGSGGRQLFDSSHMRHSVRFDIGSVVNRDQS